MKSSIAILFGLTLVLAFASSIPISENNWEGGSLIRQSGEDSENGDRAMEEGVYLKKYYIYSRRGLM
jgi:hypothetical protein